MRIRKYALLFIILLISVLPGQVAHATTIGVGLDWREQVFVQEYWFNQRIAFSSIGCSDAHNI